MPIIKRNFNNPILTINDVTPSAEELEVAGVFNPAACKFKDEYILIARVAEMCKQTAGWFKVPVLNFNGDRPRLEIKTWKREDLDLTDSRKFWIGSEQFLSSISHLRMARSKDGIHFRFSSEPFLFPEWHNEAFGVEDTRITKIENTYYLTYTAVSSDSYGVNLASTYDFDHIQRHGMILPPPNKDTCLFPEKINNKYIALHRPTTDHFAKPSVWYAESPDLIHWGNHSCILRPLENRWERQKIGVGPQPIKTPEGWLILYHGCGDNAVYSLHLCLLDLNDPRKVLKRTESPILAPKDDWEKEGFFPNVVFSNGWVSHPDGRIFIYYGAADKSICMAEMSLDDLLNLL